MAVLLKEKTYSDYENTPEGGKYQLICGEIIEKTSPSSYHQEICFRLLLKLGNFVSIKKNGKIFPAPMDVTFSPNDTVQPDLLFIEKSRYSIIQEKRIVGAPDLVVEVISPSTAYIDLKYKKDLYENSGVKEYWIVDPQDHSIEIYYKELDDFIRIQKSSKEGKVISRVLDGLEINIKDVFETE